MNNTQVVAMRNLWSDLNTPAQTETYTAREMALIPHNLSKAASIAKTKDGRTFNWSNEREMWIRIK